MLDKEGRLFVKLRGWQLVVVGLLLLLCGYVDLGILVLS